MLNLDKYKSEIEGIISSLNAKDYTIELVPGAVTNDGRLVDVIQVVIVHEATKKQGDYLYRHGHHDLKQFLQSCVNDFEKQIVRDLLNNKDANSL